MSLNTLELTKEVLLSKKYRVMNILICYNLSMGDKNKIRGKDDATKRKIRTLLSQNYTNKQICEKLNLAKSTVSKHVRELTINKLEELKDNDLLRNKVLSKGELQAIKSGSVQVLDQYLEAKVPALKNLKQKMQHYEALRPVEVTMKRMKVNELIDIGTQVIEDELKAHQSQEKTLSSRDISGLLGTLNNIAALVERQSERVTPQAIQDMPEHTIYANAQNNVIDVNSSGEPLI